VLWLKVAWCQPATAAGSHRAAWPRTKSGDESPHSRISADLPAGFKVIYQPLSFFFAPLPEII
jgi:hypothetical protein